MRTEANLVAIEAQLTENCGDLFGACRAVGISGTFINQWMKDDPKTAERVLEAQRVGRMGLVSEAIRRGRHGYDDPVFFKGIEVGTRKVYSDGLLVKALEAYVPEFRKGEGGGPNNTFNGPTQINIMPRAANYEEWLAMRDQTVAHNARPALPAPDNDIVEAQFTEVKHPLAGLGI